MKMDYRLSIVRRTYTSGSPADTEISQSSWNGDKLDGTGALVIHWIQLKLLFYLWILNG
jgi:hypothetical protein